MLKILRLLALFLESILQQFINGIGIVGLMAALAAGFLRAPWWSVLVLTFGFGVGVDLFFEGQIAISDKSASASERLIWLLLIYFFISVIGYLAGRLGRRHMERRGRAAPHLQVKSPRKAQSKDSARRNPE
ncbi:MULTISPECIES: hypothetical protein [Methylosinus]|uniref:Uncharacterized protein n=1 Tax=Methylosinus trichosporium (strain ATCC 35070 / NCIMB 11131 / UNIQEM 75 / OB3b) TaxID=595536 RepID=A0A2D2CZW2_METT3|nr:MULTISPECIES: hypothetical protein [Methylosinus]ATQ68224.1 hypothetical protein CQW49_10335 [Methylosinus trichosporium OB3b]OBS50587.1 hypothetical protein A8B73_20705 [Methylosinus sp. 3S-1]